MVETGFFKAFPKLKKHFDICAKTTLANGYILINPITQRKSYLKGFAEYTSLAKEVNNQGFWDMYRQHKREETITFERVLKPKVRAYFSAQGKYKRDACNFPIQGTSADMTKLAMVYIYREILNNNWEKQVKIVNAVHDELLVEGPKSNQENLARMVKDKMEEAAKVFCKHVTLKAQAEVGPYWIH